MKTNKFTQMIKWFIKLNPFSAFLLFVIVSPLYPLWLYSVGLYLSRKLNKSTRIFKAIAVLLIVFYYYAFGANVLLISLEISHRINMSQKDFLSMLWRLPTTIPCIVSFLIVYCFNSFYMINYEEKNSESYRPARTKIKDYVIRFITLLYSPLSIYWLQKKVNQYDAE